MPLASGDRDLIAETLLEAHGLWDDLSAMERNGLPTGFKKGHPAKRARAAKRAYDIFEQSQES